jgi:acyl carrier protein
MTDTQERLAKCFKSLLPNLVLTEMAAVELESLEGWDSVATVTLLVLIEEEFGIDLTSYDLNSDHSFNGIAESLSRKL